MLQQALPGGWPACAIRPQPPSAANAEACASAHAQRNRTDRQGWHAGILYWCTCPRPTPVDPVQAVQRIRELARAHGFQRCGIAGIELGEDEAHLADWLGQGLYGTMDWMARHGLRARPAELLPGTVRVISVGMDYSPRTTPKPGRPAAPLWRATRWAATIKLMRNRLQKLATQINDEVAPLGYRVFVDSAPCWNAHWRATPPRLDRHTCLIDRHGGSWFFIGEIYIDIRCRSTRRPRHLHALHRCLPDPGHHRPQRLDAALHFLPHHRARRRHSRRHASVDRQPHLRLRRLPAGLPWNKFAKRTDEADFRARNNLDTARLDQLFAWDEAEFLRRTEGSPIRRSGHERWLATSPWHWATHRPRPKHWPRCRPASMIPRRWCVNTCSGRWASTRRADVRS